MAGISEAQKRANAKWKEKNKDKQKVYRYRSYARKFVKDIADEKDLVELQGHIKNRLEEFKKRKGDGK